MIFELLVENMNVNSQINLEHLNTFVLINDLSPNEKIELFLIAKVSNDFNELIENWKWETL